MPGHRRQIRYPLLHVDGGMTGRLSLGKTGQQFIANHLLYLPALAFNRAGHALQATIDDSLGFLLVEALMQGNTAGHVGDHENTGGMRIVHAGGRIQVSG
jgi:hypothetical protein